jgi:hypothetical protein
MWWRFMDEKKRGFTHEPLSGQKADELIDALKRMRGEHLVHPISDDWEQILRAKPNRGIVGYELHAWEGLREGNVAPLIQLLKSGATDLHPLLAITLVEFFEGRDKLFRIDVVGQTKSPTPNTPSKISDVRRKEEAVRLLMLQEGYLMGEQKRAAFKVSKAFKNMSRKTQDRIWDRGEEIARRSYRHLKRYEEAQSLFPWRLEDRPSPEFYAHIRSIPEEWMPDPPFCNKSDMAAWVRQPNYIG